jgi:hypothetical protein
MDGLPVHRFPLTDLTRTLPGIRGLGVPNLWIERAQIRRAVKRLLPGFDLLHAHIASPLAAFALGMAHECETAVLASAGLLWKVR